MTDRAGFRDRAHGGRRPMVVVYHRHADASAAKAGDEGDGEQVAEAVAHAAHPNAAGRRHDHD